MKQLAQDEKASTVMVYTQSMLIRGDVVLRESMRVSIWPRTQGVPNFIHLYNVHLIQLAGSPPKTYTKDEAFISTHEIVGFHLAPPTQEPLDYDPAEANRKMQAVQILTGSFVMNSFLRISTATDFAASLDVMNATWMSIYDADITNPYLPQFNLRVPMLLVRPNKVIIGLL